MASGAFLTGMPRDTPWEAVPGHGRMVRSKYDSIRPRAIRTHADLTKGCRTTTQAVPQAPGADPKSQRAAFLRALKPGSTGCRRLECWTSSRADTWDFREVGLLHGLVTPLLAGAKCALESVLSQAANNRVRVTLVPWPGSTASTRTPRFSSCMGRTVPMRAEHTSQS